MTSVIQFFKTIWQYMADPTPEEKAVMAEGRPFYIVLTLILGILGIIVAFSTPQLESPIAMIGFIIVMVLHISLHWIIGFFTKNKWLSVIYLALQGLLGLIAVLISGEPGVVLAIFATMIGETLGTFGISRFAWSFVIIFLVITLLCYWFLGSVTVLENWIAPTISTMLILIIFMVLFRKQLEASKQAQVLAADLETANRQLADYALQVEQLTIETERERIARELHDTLAQGLTGMILQLEAAKEHLAAGRQSRVAEIIDRSLSRGRRTLADSRAAIDDLRAVPASFSEAIQAKIDRFTRSTGIPCELSLSLSDAELPSTTNNHIQRVLGEALANITYHSNATQVWVSLALEDEQFSLKIRDNGQGFNPETATPTGHYGLLGMRERARLIGGTVLINSQIGKGTKINLLVPLHTTNPPQGKTT